MHVCADVRPQVLTDKPFSVLVGRAGNQSAQAATFFEPPYTNQRLEKGVHPLKSQSFLEHTTSA